jgi:2-keto-4-pentenoate hydratase/2-oxohepta-3-ene-1,7-dioic acid hydratase in catechol pathway
MTHWIRYAHNGRTGFGTLDGERITVHSGNMFDRPEPEQQTLELGSVSVLTPTVPGKMVALWNNFHALAAKLGNPVPPEPLYFLKANNSFLAAGQTIRVPKSYSGKIVYEGELGL